MACEQDPRSTAKAANGQPPRSILLAHSSDLHLTSDYDPEADLARLGSVLDAASRAGADALLLAGDIFDHNRVKLALLDRVARVLGDATIPIIILPGNHDCLAPNSVYRRGGLAAVPNVEVLGVTAATSVSLPSLNLEVWGRAHPDHIDMAPLGEPHPRGAARWSVAMAHGHWVSGPHDHHRSWLIRQEDLHQLQVDYLALGHWDVARAIGDGSVPAYYSGSPDLAKTINLVRLGDDGAVVSRKALGGEANA